MLDEAIHGCHRNTFRYDRKQHKYASINQMNRTSFQFNHAKEYQMTIRTIDLLFNIYMVFCLNKISRKPPNSWLLKKWI